MQSGILISYVKPLRNAQIMADKIAALLNSPERQMEMFVQNFSAALRMTMPHIIHLDLHSFSLYQKAKAMQPISRFRRIPVGFRSRSATFRAAAPRWTPWI